MRALRKRWIASGMVPRDHAGRPLQVVPHVNGVATWHHHRAQATRERFERLKQCGRVVKRVVACPNCGVQHATPQGCGGRFVCQKCRVEVANRFRAKFERQRLGLQWAVDSSGLSARWRRAGRWGARLVTLTMPYDSDQPRVRIQRLRKAWSVFRRGFVRYLKDLVRRTYRQPKTGPETFLNPVTGEVLDGPAGLLHYVRVLEWTPGSDGLGHPHLHLWLMSPFVPREAVVGLWDSAVSGVLGRPVKTVVDVRAAGRGVARELVKYLTKDLSDTCRNGRVAVEVWAQVWAELEGARARQTSSGFGGFELEKMRLCEECGHECRSWRFWLEPVEQAQEHSPVPGNVWDLPPPAPRGAPTDSYGRWLERKDASWQDEMWAELRVARARLRKCVSRETEEIQPSLPLFGPCS